MYFDRFALAKPRHNRLKRIFPSPCRVGEHGGLPPKEEEEIGDNKNISAILEENKKLKEDLNAISPKLQKLEEAEMRREAAMKKADEDKRKKEVGADKILEEKEKELQSARERLGGYEKREQARVDGLFLKLPPQAQEALEGFRSKLSLIDWAELVEKQSGIVSVADAATETCNEMSMFLKPGGVAKRDGHEPSPTTKKILDEIGMGESMIGKMVVKREVDAESGQRLTKFTRHVKHFFNDMNQARAFRLSPKQ